MNGVGVGGVCLAAETIRRLVHGLKRNNIDDDDDTTTTTTTTTTNNGKDVYD